jgi:hypothetical protein
MTAIDIGVTETCPWPIATEIVSPGYQLLAGALQLPGGGGHEAVDFVRQIDALFVGQAELRCPVVNAVDAEHGCRPCRSRRVARLLDRVPHVHPAVVADRWHLKNRP